MGQNTWTHRIFTILLLTLITQAAIEETGKNEIEVEDKKEIKVKEKDNLVKLREHWAKATQELRKNLVKTFRALSNETLEVGSSIAKSAQVLLICLRNNTISLASVLGYVPQIILLDIPSQILETLRIIRQNRRENNQSTQNGVLNEALDNLILFFHNSTTSQRITQKTQPAWDFLPNIFRGIGDFFKSLIDAVYHLLQK